MKSALSLVLVRTQQADAPRLCIEESQNQKLTACSGRLSDDLCVSEEVINILESH